MEITSVRTLAACVVAGRFNPAILSPDWMVKQGILPPASAVQVMQQFGGGLLATQGASLPQFQSGDIIWRASLNTLEISVQGDDTNPGELVKRILTLLPHTPVLGVGNNFAFEFAPPVGARLLPIMESRFGSALVSKKHERLASSVKVTLSHADGIVTITSQASASAATTMEFNFHRAAATTEDASAAAQAWPSDRDEAFKLHTLILALSS